MIRLSNLFKWVNTGSQRVFILRDIHLNIEQGEFISIMGPSGSGKSSLLNIIGMLDTPSQGRHYYPGNPFRKK